jgi:hypothetical protein
MTGNDGLAQVARDTFTAILDLTRTAFADVTAEPGLVVDHGTTATHGATRVTVQLTAWPDGEYPQLAEPTATAAAPQMRLTGSRTEIDLMVVRLRQSFSAVDPGDVYLGDDGYVHCDVEVTF